MVHVQVGSLSHVVSNIGIAPGAQARVEIETNAGGNHAASAVTLASGTPWVVYAAAYDADGNYRPGGAVGFGWSAVGGMGTLSAYTGTSVTFTGTAALAGSVW